MLDSLHAREDDRKPGEQNSANDDVLKIAFQSYLIRFLPQFTFISSKFLIQYTNQEFKLISDYAGKYVDLR